MTTITLALHLTLHVLALTRALLYILVREHDEHPLISHHSLGMTQSTPLDVGFLVYEVKLRPRS